MKNGLIAAIAFATCFCGHAENAVITGHGSGLPDSTEVILLRMMGQAGTSVARDTVIGGSFRLVVPVDSGLMKTGLSVNAPCIPSMDRTIYLRPGANVEVEAPDYCIHTWPVRSDVPEQAADDRFLLNSKDLWDAYQRRDVEYAQAMMTAADAAIRDSVSNAYRATEYIADSLMMAVGHRDIALLRTLPVDASWLGKAESIARSQEFYKDSPGSYTQAMQSLFSQLDEAVRTSEAGQRIERLLYPPKTVEIGDTVPDGIFYDIDGNTHRLADYRGKWLLLDFWSRGCYACVMAQPELHEFAQKYAGTAELVSLSIDTDKMWREATESYKLEGNNWNEGMEDLGLYRNFGAKGMPTFVLVSPEGIVKDQFLGYSKGVFDRMIRFHTSPKEKMTVTGNDSRRIVTAPDYTSNSTSYILDIERIERTDAGTTLSFSVRYIPGWWITIDPQAFLTTDAGSRYKLTGSDGITPGEHFTADADGAGSFTLTFEPVPAAATTVDFCESPSANWRITGIRMK